MNLKGDAVRMMVDSREIDRMYRDAEERFGYPYPEPDDKEDYNWLLIAILVFVGSICVVCVTGMAVAAVCMFRRNR